MFARNQERLFEEILPGVEQRTLSITPTMMMCEARLRGGSHVPPHEHPHEQASYIVTGRLRVRIHEEEATLEAGDAYAIPGGVLHAIDVLNDTVVVDVFTPHRSEYALERYLHPGARR